MKFNSNFHSACHISIFILFVSISLHSENLLRNPGMEESDTAFPGWSEIYYSSGSVFAIERQNPHAGRNCVSIENKDLNDSRLVQSVYVEENTKYRLSAWIRAEGVNINSGGANISLADFFFASQPVFETNGKWQRVEFYLYVETEVTQVAIGIRLGNFANVSRGKAYFDDVSMEKVSSIPGGSTSFKIGVPASLDSEMIDPYVILAFVFSILAAVAFSLNFIVNPKHLHKSGNRG